MPQRVFLSFNCDRDAARALHVAGSRGLLETCEGRGVLSRSEWAALERRGRAALQPWVHYAIQRSRAEGKGMIGVRVHRPADPRTGLCDYRGLNPFEINHGTGSVPPVFLNSLYPTYDWVADAGERNLRAWIDAAASRAVSSVAPGSRPLAARQPDRSRPLSSCAFSSYRRVSDDWTPAAWSAEP